jgi:hypothetical protein
MKRNLTSVILAGAMLSLACAVVPAAGQKKAVMKAVRAENPPALQLRAGEASPDSAIVYSPTGEKTEKHVYLPGESHGKYVWEIGTWNFLSNNPNTWYLGWYDREIYNNPRTVFYQNSDGKLVFFVPRLGNWLTYSFPEYTDLSTNYDENGNLTFLRVLYDGGWAEFTVTYNTDHNPVSIEYRTQSEKDGHIWNYEYNDYGYCTLIDSYYYWYGTWFDWGRETSVYDAQGKLLYADFYEYDKITYKYNYEYYDENHFSSITKMYYNSWSLSIPTREEWKYGTDGKPETYYYYENDKLSYYVNFYYGNSSSVEALPENVARVWSSGGQLYIAGVASGAAQVYSVAGQLLKTVSFTAGQTTATPLPRGIYIVVAEGQTWKVYMPEL